MLITLILIAVLVIGIIADILYFKVDLWEEEWLNVVGFFAKLIGGAGLFLALLIIFSTHINVDHQIERERIEYEGLCKKIEVIQSNYEDASKLDVIEEAVNQNRYVEKCRYYNNNIWTSWFYPDRYVDSLKTIDISNIKK